MQNASTKTALSVADIITDKILTSLEKGEVIWQKPWKVLKPQNGVSRKEYRGINHLLLSVLGEDTYFLTFNQVKSLGGFIEKGTKGLPVVYYKPIEKTDKVTGEVKKTFILRYSSVFPVSKCGLPNFKRDVVNALTFVPVEQAEAIASLSKVPVTFGGSRAFYTPATHSIQMPVKESFKTIANFYATLFHEIGHSLKSDKHLFDTENYAKEELVAEIFASIALNHCGLLGEVIFDNTTAYLQSWLKSLGNDKKLIISATSEAWKRWEKLNGKAEQVEESEED